jgi:formylglycine-generating enzyme required for sulfatase activity
MMKSSIFVPGALVLGLFFALNNATASEVPHPFIYETPNEFFGTGDFDGDGRADVIIMDKETGKFRIGYQLTNGVVSWGDCRPTGEKGITGFSIGKLFDAKHDAVAVSVPEANRLVLVEASNPTETARPRPIGFDAGLGPNSIVAIDIGGQGNDAKEDLYVASRENSPDPFQAALLRNDGSTFPKIADAPLTGAAVQANRLVPKPGGPELLAEIITAEQNDNFMVDDLHTGKPVNVSAVKELGRGTQYAAGHFSKAPALDVIFYKPGETRAKVFMGLVSDSTASRSVTSSSFELTDPILRVIPLQQGADTKLFVIFGKGEKGGVYDFDGKTAPRLVQTIVSTNELLTGAEMVDGGLLAFSHQPDVKPSMRYLSYKSSGSRYEFSAFGGLPSLADNDNMTIPDIYEHIVANTKEKNQSDMKAYTNAIPGTPVKYSMVPIPGGEFVMGSADSEPGHKPDEGPQHNVKISPFWMQQFEITWNEYELFMYPDEEQGMRARFPSDESADKLADGVTHPSKPYVEMSFGMGKDGFPAIAMTQHAANKYCQWLSAKTGHFYRLPTEAEWEYACRAGTKTTYFWGDDGSKLGEYAWYEQNSDFKYQKIGKKKPNPWGLYDIYGNVVEWVLDQYDPDYYKKTPAGALDPWNKPTQPYPLAVRGGSWDDEAPMCRSAARRGSDRSWKMQDPQLPKSIWYFTDAQFIGFRIVRPLKVPSPQEMQHYWSNGVERD